MASCRFPYFLTFWSVNLEKKKGYYLGKTNDFFFSVQRRPIETEEEKRKIKIQGESFCHFTYNNSNNNNNTNNSNNNNNTTTITNNNNNTNNNISSSKGKDEVSVTILGVIEVVLVEWKESRTENDAQRHSGPYSEMLCSITTANFQGHRERLAWLSKVFLI